MLACSAAKLSAIWPYVDVIELFNARIDFTRASISASTADITSSCSLANKQTGRSKEQKI